MQAGGLGGEGEHKQRNESCKHKSAPIEARRVRQDGNPSWGGWKMKKEVGIRFESCRRLTPGNGTGAGWGGGGDGIFCLPLETSFPKGGGESTSTACRGTSSGKAQDLQG